MPVSLRQESRQAPGGSLSPRSTDDSVRQINAPTRKLVPQGLLDHESPVKVSAILGSPNGAGAAPEGP